MAGKRWNGSSFVDITTKKRWNGTAWVNITTAKRWTGSAWVDLFPAGGTTFTLTLADFYGSFFCTGNTCPISRTLSDTNTYTISGGTAPYTVTASVFSGVPVTINTATAGQITVSTTVGRNDFKEGTIAITITDSSSTPITNVFYRDYSFSYVYEGTSGGGTEIP